MADSDLVRVLIGGVPAKMSLTNLAAELDPILAATTNTSVIRSVTGNAALTSADNTLLVDSTSGNLAVTMPQPSTVFNSSTSVSSKFTVAQKVAGGNTVTINPFASESFYEGSAQSSIVLSSGASATFETDGTDWVVVSS
jgi:hypothetical protein